MKKILIIDDDPLFTSFLKKSFENDYDITICHSCCEAVNKLTVESFDLITLDITMPILDGIETFGIIRRFCTTPVIIITSMVTDELIQKIKLLSIPFMLKPVSHKHLFEKIQEMLQ